MLQTPQNMQYTLTYTHVCLQIHSHLNRNESATAKLKRWGGWKTGWNKAKKKECMNERENKKRFSLLRMLADCSVRDWPLPTHKQRLPLYHLVSALSLTHSLLQTCSHWPRLYSGRRLSVLESLLPLKWSISKAMLDFLSWCQLCVFNLQRISSLKGKHATNPANISALTVLQNLWIPQAYEGNSCT